ncbi:MAG: DUF362 domain-containing protein [Dehalococcoidia bacterium]|jgi:hypothetical protein|nr:DUF362 domain-containing protein [Dehalococcoidia bacterium]|tara:strand:- start:12938 stop:14425 length:1488 start_codon:yes stop_codon:yes gene_type:complete
MTSDVYFMDARSDSADTSLIAKTVTVFDAAGLDELVEPGDVVAIKLHCGEWNSSAYLRPVYARAIADRVKELGGRPFVCDTTTLTYSPFSTRATELDLLQTAERNGFSSAVLGCPFIAADGYVGTSDYRVDIPEGYLLKEAYVAQAIAAADVLIALTHFKGHGMGVIGGALKNLGIGGQSKRGKFNVHMGGHPKYGVGAVVEFDEKFVVDKEKDIEWELIEEACPIGLFEIQEDNTIAWDRDKCMTCLGCLGVMNPRGIFQPNQMLFDATDIAIGDAALGVVKTVPKVGFVTLAIDVSPKCDCAGFSDMPIVPNLGVFASKDPVAIDQACVDAVTDSPGIPGSLSDEMGVGDAGERKFDLAGAAIEGLSEQTTINTAVVNGLGSRNYELHHVEPVGREKFRFPYDERPTRQRFARMFEKFQPFPFDRHDGHGFDRLPEVDIEAVKPHDGPTVGTHSHAPYHGDGTSHGPNGHSAPENQWHPGEEGTRSHSTTHEH